MATLGWIGLIMQGASMVMSASAAHQAASNSQAIGNYNASVSEYEARQLDVDAQAAVTQSRQDAKVYISRQAASYAKAGVLNTGSPLAVQAATAGRLEMGAQQMYRNAQLKERSLYAEAQASRMYGASSAKQANLQMWGGLLGGTANIASGLYRDYKTGAGIYSNG